MSKVEQMIAEQQKGLEYTDVYTVGEQLKDICRREPHCAKLLEEDLKNKSMSLEAAANKIKAWADEQHRKGGANRRNAVGVPGSVAEKILREFYGLPDAMPEAQEEPAAEPSAPVLDLASFF